MRIAVAQMPGASLEQSRETLQLAEELIRRAARRGAELVVLPECAWPAYWLGSSAAYRRARVAGLPGPEFFLERVGRVARDAHIAVCTGYIAEQADRLFNAAGLIDATGQLVGTQHKRFLWAFDREVFEPGQHIEPLTTEHGPIGLMICADARLPEIPATLAARGARLLLHPTAWVNTASTGQPWNPQPDFLIPARAAELGVPIASASKWGREGDTTFVGSSLICDAQGRVLAQCGIAETAVVTAEVELTAPRGPIVADSERAILLSTEAPSLPRADVGPLTVLVIPPDGGDEQISTGLPSRPDVSGCVLALCLDIRAAARDHVPPTPGPGYVLLRGPTTDPVEIGGVRIHALRTSDAARFAAIRCLALRGVHVAVVFGTEAVLSDLKARACENRVFVMAVTPEGWCAIDPRGYVVAEQGWPACGSGPAVVELNVAETATKTVAPNTDVIAGRRPDQYAF